MKKTEWFNGRVQPVHIGDYEVYRPGFTLIPCSHMLHWNGSSWEYAYELGECDRGDHASMTSDCQWRGLDGASSMKNTSKLDAPAMETTDWYPADVRPVRDGVYQLHNTSTDTIFHANWHNGAWALGCMWASNAAQFKSPSVVQNRWPWRGLKEHAA